MESKEKFTYWKRPWHKLLVFVGAVLQIVSMVLKIQDFNDLAKLGLFSPAQWETFVVHESFKITTNGLLAALFLGIVAIGEFAKTKGSARRAEGLLLLALSLALGIAGVVHRFNTQTLTNLIWLLLLLLTLVSGIYLLWKYRKSKQTPI